MSRRDDPAFARLAGHARLADGSRISWMVADGHRGRRWRASTLSPDGRLVQTLLLEVTPDGRATRLEVAAPEGLLTLHPGAGDDALHGNVVRDGGVEHITLPWSAERGLLVGASPIAAVVALAGMALRVGVGEGGFLAGVDVGPGLEVRPATWQVERLGERRWRIRREDGGGQLIVEHDQAGVPMGLDSAGTWPLERDPAE